MDLFQAILWLTLNLYHEGRGECTVGQQAIVHVVLNRMEKRNLSLKEIVLQKSQFSWTKKPSHLYTPANPDAFWNCMKVINSTVGEIDFTRGATHYHSLSVHPSWADELEYIDTIGNHKFYRQKK